MRPISLASGSLIAAVLVHSSVASAHFRLKYPTPRYPAPAMEDGSELKNAPCGVTGDTRTTDASRITTFTPGQQITLQWTETIAHPGHYRIAFDNDGQDNLKEPTSYTDIVNPPVLPVLLDGIPSKDAPVSYTQTITLPNVQCQRCTLQVIQVMTDKPPYAVNGNDVYHQCADIVIAGPLVGSGGTGDAGATGSGGSNAAGGDTGAGGTGTSTAGSTGTAGTGVSTAGTGAGTAGDGSGTAGASTGTAGSPGIAGDTPVTAPNDAPANSSDSGGCSLARAAGVSSGALGSATLLAFALGILGVRRRRAGR